jgi:hypothetical protein
MDNYGSKMFNTFARTKSTSRPEPTVPQTESNPRPSGVVTGSQFSTAPLTNSITSPIGNE